MRNTRKSSFLYQSPMITNCCLVVFALLIVVVWAWITHDWWRYGRIEKGIGSSVGILGYTLFSFSLFLSSRWKKLEDWIGGLDRVYHLHHNLGIWGFCLLLAHPWIHALKWLPQHVDRFFWTIFPVHNRFSVNLGSYAFWLMCMIVVVTIFKLLPYDKWKLVHRLMSLVFLLASLHFLLSSRRFDPSFAALVPLFVPMFIGFFGIFYKQLWMPLFYPFKRYLVLDTKKVTDNVLMITLKPQAEGLSFSPGQFAFFSFRGDFSKEQHPFTICNTQDNRISILMKARGDFTRSLYANLKRNTEAFLEGPYGRFDYRWGRKDQIWLAGGIGIVPFLAWCQSIQDWSGKINLFYCVRRNEDVLFLSEFQELQKRGKFFDFHLFCSEKKQHLIIDDIRHLVQNIQDNSIFMCGPKKLTGHFLQEFQNHGVSRKQIHFEDFEFFGKSS